MSVFTFDYRPLPVHHAFHMDTSYERTVFGGYGSGKSYALCAEAIAVALEQPGSEILVCRKTIPSLRDTTEAIFMGLLPPELFNQCAKSRMGGHYESITFPNGSKVMFRGLDDWMKLKSLNVAFIFFDEVDEIDEETYVGMMSRVRQTVPSAKAKALGYKEITRRGICSASNPAGHNWCWKRWVGPTKIANSAHFTSTSLDNPYLPLDYINQLLSMPEPWIRRYVLCGFDDFAGQIYDSFTWDSHVVPPYTELDPRGFIWMGMDPGTHDPTAGVWCYYDRAKHWLVAVAEYQEAGLAANVHAAAWQRIEARFGRCRVRRRIADPNVTTRDRGTNMALSDQYRRLGFNFEQGPRLIEDRLPMLGRLIVEGRFKVAADCPQMYEQLRDYKWEDLSPAQRQKGSEPKPLKKNVHLVDCAQYVASRYISQPLVLPSDDPEDDKAAFQHEVRAAIRKQILESRTATTNHDLGSMAL